MVHSTYIGFHVNDTITWNHIWSGDFITRSSITWYVIKHFTECSIVKIRVVWTHAVDSEMNIARIAQNSFQTSIAQTRATQVHVHASLVTDWPSAWLLKWLRDVSRTFAIRHSMANVKVWHSRCEVILPFGFSCSCFEGGGVMRDSLGGKVILCEIIVIRSRMVLMLMEYVFLFVSLLSHFWLIHLFYLHLLYQPYVGFCQATRVQSHHRQSTSAVAIATCEVQVSAADYQTIPTVATGVSKPLFCRLTLTFTLTSENLSLYITLLL